MSCFIVANETIDRIAEHIAEDGDCYTCLARKLLDINVRAFLYRYAGRYRDGCPEPGEHQWRPPQTPGGAAQLAKSLACYAYQCSEGQPMSVADEALFKRVLEAGESFRGMVGTASYDAAAWR